MALLKAYYPILYEEMNETTVVGFLRDNNTYKRLAFNGSESLDISYLVVIFQQV